MSNVYVLLQFGDDPLRHRYVDPDGRSAFTIAKVAQAPNPIIRLSREAEWSQQHPTIMGPDNSFFYLGPESAVGFLAYGSSKINIPMGYFLRPGKKENSLSRYFRGQNGKDYKWKIGSHRMECHDNGRILATWEVSQPNEEYHARLILVPNALPLVTEIVTTLILNQMALALGW